MAAKRTQPVDYGNLPRDGYVYSLYRGHVIRLGLVVAALVAIALWAWNGSQTAIRSYLFPGGTADLAALAETALPQAAPSAEGSVFDTDQIDETGVWVQNHCYRLTVSLDAVESLDIIVDDAQLYLVTAGGHRFLAATQAAASPPAAGTTCRAVFTPVSGQLVASLPETLDRDALSGYLMDLRPLPVGQEVVDTVQMLVFVPVVVLLLGLWLALLQNPGRHPIYRQLSRYGLSVAEVVAAIDREVAMGEIVADERRRMVTTSWDLQKSAFMTVIYRNTAAAGSAEKERSSDE